MLQYITSTLMVVIMNKKIFEVDIDSLEECQLFMVKIKGILGQLKAEEFGSKNQRKKIEFQACQNIYETDISSVYRNIKLDDKPIYYVYMHSAGAKIAVGKCGKSTFGATLGMKELPFYIGKGTGNRAHDLNRNETHRKMRQRLHTFGKEVNVTILKSDLTELEALILESKLIDIFGLITVGGRLVNLDEGVNSKERRALYSTDLAKISKFFKNSV